MKPASQVPPASTNPQGGRGGRDVSLVKSRSSGLEVSSFRFRVNGNQLRKYETCHAKLYSVPASGQLGSVSAEHNMFFNEKPAQDLFAGPMVLCREQAEMEKKGESAPDLPLSRQLRKHETRNPQLETEAHRASRRHRLPSAGDFQ